MTIYKCGHGVRKPGICMSNQIMEMCQHSDSSTFFWLEGTCVRSWVGSSSSPQFSSGLWIQVELTRIKVRLQFLFTQVHNPTHEMKPGSDLTSTKSNRRIEVNIIVVLSGYIKDGGGSGWSSPGSCPDFPAKTRIRNPGSPWNHYYSIMDGFLLSVRTENLIYFMITRPTNITENITPNDKCKVHLSSELI